MRLVLSFSDNILPDSEPYLDTDVMCPRHSRGEQGVALTGRNTTGSPRTAPGELRCAVARLQYV